MTNVNLIVKRGYVGSMRMLATVLKPLHAADVRIDARQRRYRHWLQSLLAIHDIDALIRLDVPWWTYDAIEAVDEFLSTRQDARVFEYGSGASTIWLAKRAGSVVSVDHDPSWIGVARSRLQGWNNASIELITRDDPQRADEAYASGKSGHRGETFAEYAHGIDRLSGLFDLIVIDGRARAACLRRAVPRLAPDGMIVFDNSHRARYRKAIADCGLREEVLRGLAPSLPFPDQTSLLRIARAVT